MKSILRSLTSVAGNVRKKLAKCRGSFSVTHDPIGPRFNPQVSAPFVRLDKAQSVPSLAVNENAGSPGGLPPIIKGRVEGTHLEPPMEPSVVLSENLPPVLEGNQKITQNLEGVGNSLPSTKRHRGAAPLDMSSLRRSSTVSDLGLSRKSGDDYPESSDHYELVSSGTTALVYRIPPKDSRQ
jgi:hypothetical protein